MLLIVVDSLTVVLLEPPFLSYAYCVLIKHVYEPEYITGPSGVIPIAVLKEESTIEINY
jgi:hypothetical protein